MILLVVDIFLRVISLLTILQGDCSMSDIGLSLGLLLVGIILIFFAI